jgi:ABC-type phosphate transport system substrate-binding protein
MRVQKCHRGAPARAILAGAAIALASLVTLITSLPASAESGHEQIEGSGSSWAALAVQQWVSDESSSMQVVYTPSGSAQGRTDFANGQNDFAVSDIGYQGQNKETGVNDTSKRPYAYLPIVGGATSFPYNIVVRGRQVKNLRLSGLTLAKIFTDQITNWDNPEITANNNGHALPSIPIIPVIHSEGAGTTYQFTDYLNTEFPQLWRKFSGYSFPVEFWPTGQGSQVAENGSDGVMGFVSSAAGQGSIGYDEYAYAIGASFPVVALENSDGYFTMPDAYDAAVSLTQAHINYNQNPADCPKLGFPTTPCYLLETLNDVYTYKDPRTYPLSSYSYEIMPTARTCNGPVTKCDPTMNTAKRQTLADFDDFSLCAGQSQMAPIGYSPLPINLVEASFEQVKLLHSADHGVVVSELNPAHCNNPTFIPGHPDENYLAKIAPYPPACAKAGQGPCPGQYAHNGNPIGGHPGGASRSKGESASIVTAQAKKRHPATTITTTQPKKKRPATTPVSSSNAANSVTASATATTTSATTTTRVISGARGMTMSFLAKPTATTPVRAGATTRAMSVPGSVGTSELTSQVFPQAVPTVLTGDHPGGLRYFAPGLTVAALLVVGLWSPALLRPARRRLARWGSGR